MLLMLMLLLMLLLLIQTHSDAFLVTACTNDAEGKGTWQKQREDKGGKEFLQSFL